ncbi:uncharacterized protein LOC135336931 isoform X1 [Halichondria panicea]|uniref:uncharacterized protein LOC135336931 isoform X1 n=1 Tax=Halichondria panicea TaxID=6063 RepID=UPI00312B9F90
MEECWYLTILFLLQYFNKFIVMEACLLSPPEPVVGFSGQRISLNCSLCTGSITVFWIVDGMDSISLADTQLMAQNELFQVSPSVLNSRLSFTAISESNHTIQCVVYGPDRMIERSDPITIPVQGALSSPPNFHVNTTIFRNIHIINLMWDPPPSLVTVSLYSVAVRINSSFELILIHQPLYEYKYNYSGCEDMEVEFGVRADNPAGAGNFSNMTVLIAGCVITPSTTLRNTVVKFTSAINSTQNSLRFTFTVPIASTIDTTRDYDLGLVAYICAPVTAIVTTILMIISIMVWKWRQYQSKQQTVEHPPECIPTCKNSAYGEVQLIVKNEAYASLPGTQHIYETIK